MQLSDSAHQAAKAKAASAGMKLYCFIELAIANFQVRLVHRTERSKRRKAG